MSKQESINTKNINIPVASYNKLAFLNPLKFVGAIMIAIFLHYDEHFLSKLGHENNLAANPLLGVLFKKSFIFVEMFFVISGLLFVIAYQNRITSKIENNLANNKPLGFASFMLGRYKRIFPLVIITSIYMYILNVILVSKTGLLWAAGSTSVLDLLGNIIYGGNSILAGTKTLNGPIWYVQILLICYALAYVITKLVTNIKKEVRIIVFTLPIILGIIMRSTSVNYPFWNEDFSRGLIAFFAGILLGHFLTVFDAFSKVTKLIIKAICSLVILAILFLVAFKSELLSPITTYVALLLFPEIIIVLYDLKLVNNICSNSFFKILGDISFGIYLWNFPILITLHTLIVTNAITPDVNSILFIILLLMAHILIAICYDKIAKLIQTKKP